MAGRSGRQSLESIMDGLPDLECLVEEPTQRSPRDSSREESNFPWLIGSSHQLDFIDEAVGLIEQDGPLRKLLDGSAPSMPSAAQELQTVKSVPNKKLTGITLALAALDSPSEPQSEGRLGNSQDESLPHHLLKEQLKLHYHLPSKDAAKQLGINVPILQRVCRIFGINRWPYRKFHSLESLRKAVEEDHSLGNIAREAVLANIDAETATLNEDPNREIGPLVEALRQVHFKQVSTLKGPKEITAPDQNLKCCAATATHQHDTSKKKRCTRTKSTYLSNAVHRSMDLLSGSAGAVTKSAANSTVATFEHTLSSLGSIPGCTVSPPYGNQEMMLCSGEHLIDGGVDGYLCDMYRGGIMPPRMTKADLNNNNLRMKESIAPLSSNPDSITSLGDQQAPSSEWELTGFGHRYLPPADVRLSGQVASIQSMDSGGPLDHHTAIGYAHESMSHLLQGDGVNSMQGCSVNLIQESLEALVPPWADGCALFQGASVNYLQGAQDDLSGLVCEAWQQQGHLADALMGSLQDLMFGAEANSQEDVATEPDDAGGMMMAGQLEHQSQHRTNPHLAANHLATNHLATNLLASNPGAMLQDISFFEGGLLNDDWGFAKGLELQVESLNEPHCTNAWWEDSDPYQQAKGGFEMHQSDFQAGSRS